jgi:hypothetical protein
MLLFMAISKTAAAALLHLNKAQLVRIQKHEWMEAYIRADQRYAIIRTLNLRGMVLV